MSAISRLRKSLPKLEKEYQRRLDEGEHSREMDMMKRILELVKAFLNENEEIFAKSSEK